MIIHARRPANNGGSTRLATHCRFRSVVRRGGSRFHRAPAVPADEACGRACRRSRIAGPKLTVDARPSPLAEATVSGGIIGAGGGLNGPEPFPAYVSDARFASRMRTHHDQRLRVHVVVVAELSSVERGGDPAIVP